MNWPVTIGVIAGFVVGANLGVLLMVALRAGRRHDDAYDNAALIVRIQELERALVRPTATPPAAVGTAARSLHGIATDEVRDDARLHNSNRAS